MFKPCLLFPCYNHSEQFGRFLPQLLPLPCPAIVVDDGSTPEEAAALKKLARGGAFKLIRSEANKGKGEAVRLGIAHAAKAGYTHVFQIDADGQHDPAQIAKFLSVARQNPDCAIFGAPKYDATVPKLRLFGRKITNFFVALETLSLRMADGLCGFRVYPVRAVAPFLSKKIWSQRMGFDVCILVEMHWAGTPIMFLPVHVVYPAGGKSHFSLIGGNARVARAHAGLCVRAPFRLAAKFFRRRRG